MLQWAKGSKTPVISTIFVLFLLLGRFHSSSSQISVSADPTVPSAPTGLTATPGDRQVFLTWNAPSDDGGSPITSYNMWRGTTPGGEVLITSVGNALTFTCTGRTNGVTYYFKITAVNAIGDGPPSNEASATPMAVPNAPTGLTATPGNAKVVLKWNAPSNDGGSDITQYNVYRSTLPNKETLIKELGNVLTFNDLGLVNGVTYYYQVSAVNVKGIGPRSNEAFATPANVPSAPTLTSATPGDAHVVLSWTAPSNGGTAITNYSVYRGTTSGGETLFITLGDVLNYTDSGLTNGLMYYYKVKAVNSVGEGALSNGLGARPGGSPAGPQGLLAMPGDTYVDLTWQTPSNDGGSAITKYNVWRGTTSGNETFHADAGLNLWFKDTGLTNGEIYYYHVTAVNSIGEGAPSNEVSSTPVTVPSVIRDLEAEVGDEVLNLSWTMPTYVGPGNITYHLFRDGSEIWSGTEMTYSDSPVTNEVTYSYKVAAQNSIGWGPNCTAILATPHSSDAVPTAPTGLVVKSGDQFVDLSWTPPSYAGPGTLVYHLFRDGAQIWSGAGLSYNDTTVTNDITYSYKVAAQNSIGWGPNCTAIFATPISVGMVPSMPEGLKATDGNELVDLEWTVPAYEGPGMITYHLFRDDTEVWSGTTTTYTDSKVTKGDQYSYKVAAQNSIGWGPNCTVVFASPFGVPDVPWGLSVDQGDGQTSMSWNAVNYSGPGPLTYHLFRGGVEVYNGTSTSYDDAGLENGITFVYNVAASNSIGWSDNSSSVSGTPQGPPTAPQGLDAEPGDGFVLLNWTTPTYGGPGTLTFHLFRNGTSTLVWHIAQLQ